MLIQKGATLCHQLNWSHYREVLIIKYIDDIGQIQTYMNYIDKNLKALNQDKTIGVIIVRKNNKFIMQYCSDKRILAKEYELL